MQRAHTLLDDRWPLPVGEVHRVAEWATDELHTARESTEHVASARAYITWRATALAPPGLCHVRSTMIGTLLEDIAAGKDFEDIKRSFDYRSTRRLPAPAGAADGWAARRSPRRSSRAGVVPIAACAHRSPALAEDVLDELVGCQALGVEKPGGSVFGYDEGPAGRTDADRRAGAGHHVARVLADGASRRRRRHRVPLCRGTEIFAFVTAADASAPPSSCSGTAAGLAQSGQLDILPHGDRTRRSGACPPGSSYRWQLSRRSRPRGNDNYDHGNGVYVVLEGARNRRSAASVSSPRSLKPSTTASAPRSRPTRESRQIADVDVPVCGWRSRRAACGTGTCASRPRALRVFNLLEVGLRPSTGLPSCGSHWWRAQL